MNVAWNANSAKSIIRSIKVTCQDPYASLYFASGGGHLRVRMIWYVVIPAVICAAVPVITPVSRSSSWAATQVLTDSSRWEEGRRPFSDRHAYGRPQDPLSLRSNSCDVRIMGVIGHP